MGRMPSAGSFYPTRAWRDFVRPSWQGHALNFTTEDLAIDPPTTRVDYGAVDPQALDAVHRRCRRVLGRNTAKLVAPEIVARGIDHTWDGLELVDDEPDDGKQVVLYAAPEDLPRIDDLISEAQPQAAGIADDRLTLVTYHIRERGTGRLLAEGAALVNATRSDSRRLLRRTAPGSGLMGSFADGEVTVVATEAWRTCRGPVRHEQQRRRPLDPIRSGEWRSIALQPCHPDRPQPYLLSAKVGSTTVSMIADSVDEASARDLAMRYLSAHVLPRCFPEHRGDVIWRACERLIDIAYARRLLLIDADRRVSSMRPCRVIAMESRHPLRYDWRRQLPQP